MKVLVSDSSVLIEFSERGILDRMFELDFRFAVPDLLFYEELIDLGRYSRQDLLSFGLQVEALDPEGVELAVSYQHRRTDLSLVDSFALALAYRREWDLLTEDRVMGSFANAEGITHHGALWVIDRMSHDGILSDTLVVTVLEAMRDDPRCPLPNHVLVARGHKFRKGTI